MLYAGLAVLGLVLAVGGGLYGYREFLRSKPAPIWVPLALRADISMEDQNKLAKEIEERLRNEDLLRKVVKDADLQAKFNLPSEEATVRELEQRLFVRAGTAETPQGTVPAVHIGFNGKGGEKDALGAASTRIIKDVWVMIGIDPETGRPASAGTPDDMPADSGFSSPMPELK